MTLSIQNQEKFLNESRSRHPWVCKIISYLLGIQNKHLITRPSQKRIAKRVGISRSQVNRGLDMLEEQGIVYRHQSPFGNTTVYTFSEIFNDSAVCSRLVPCIPSLWYRAYPGLPVWLLTSTLKGAMDRVDTLLYKEIIGIKNISLSYCKSLGMLFQLSFQDWLTLEQFPSDLTETVINRMRGLANAKKKIFKPFRYIYSSLLRETEWFDIPRNTIKAIRLLNVFQSNPEILAPKKRYAEWWLNVEKPLKREARKSSYFVGDYAMQSNQDRNEQRVLSKEYIARRRAGHSPMVEVAPGKQNTHEEQLAKIKEKLQTPEWQKLRALWGDDYMRDLCMSMLEVSKSETA